MVKKATSLSFHPFTAARRTKILTGESCSDDIHPSTPASPVEGGKFVPDRRICENPIPNPGP